MQKHLKAFVSNFLSKSIELGKSTSSARDQGEPWPMVSNDFVVDVDVANFDDGHRALLGDVDKDKKIEAA
jgi:hypothetical protein